MGDTDEPGYRHVVVRPRPGSGFSYATASLITPYGRAGSGWRLDGDHMSVTAIIPANAHGTVYLPGARLEDVREGSVPVSSAAGVARAEQVGDMVRVEVGSGVVRVRVPQPAVGSP